MKTHTNNIIARLLVLLVAALTFAPAEAQNNRQYAIYNYLNDGDINGFLYFEIDSITYSCVDTLGVEHEYVVVQEIWTPDKVYRIPLENIDSISFRTPNSEMETELSYSRWTNASVSEIEERLKESCNSDESDIDALVSVLNTNGNVEQTYSSLDSLSLIVRYKDSNDISVYPIHLPIDPFDETNGSMSYRSLSSNNKIRALAPEYNYKKIGANGVVAVFNYFSNNHYGDDAYGSRTTQNMLLDYMCRELNQKDYGVEYYGYDEMTLSALKHVLNNTSTYRAVVVISHGFSDGQQSYFLIGEEFDSDKARNDPFLKDEGYELPFKYKFWNDGLYGLKERYDFVVPVKKMNFGDNVLLYMGSCDAYRHDSDMKGKCVGWDGTNCSAQAHVALLFHKLLRGKNLYDALDLDDREYYYYFTTVAQTDTWKKDLEYEDSHLKTSWDANYNSGIIYVGGGIAKRQWAQYPKYFESGNNIPKIIVRDGDDTPILKGICSMKDHKFRLKFSCNDDLPGDYVWIKATPLRADVAPIIKKIKINKLNKGFKIELEANGVYELSAAIDENFSKEILLHKPVVFVYAKPFKDNSIPLGDDDDLFTFNVNGVSFDMVPIEGGAFMMGSPDDDPDAGGIYSDEKPQHQVALDSFCIGETEVTQALWMAVMGNNPSIYKGDDLPVEEVSWEDCQTFISKLNSITGCRFRMPTEAEWEYAARGGKNSKGYKYAGGDEVNNVAWTYENCNGTTHPVATKPANELGLYDMSGNVWEWCQDWYDGGYYRKSPTNNPCNTSQTSEYRIHRGGSIEYILKDLRVAMRGDYVNPPSNRLRGLRLAMSDVAALQSIIKVSPATLEFGEVEMNKSGRSRLTITNTGTETMQVKVEVPSSFEIEGAEAGDKFMVYDVTPNSSRYVYILFYPRAELTYQGDITITSNGLEGGKHIVPVSGKGVAEVVQTEIITIPGTNVSFKMVAVEGGSFMMGAADDDRDAHSDERPLHQVTLSDFSIGETEVTQELWEAVMGGNPSSHQGSNLPVEQISRDDCSVFISKLNRLTGGNFRLPTEAEWEYAARGGKNSKGFKYAGGNAINVVAWYNNNSEGNTHPVAEKQANELGLYDMSGNVWEIVQDYYDRNYYSISPANNPCNTTPSNLYAMRGGGCNNTSSFCRVTFRAEQVLLDDTQTPVDSNWDIGLRLAR